MRVKLNHLLSDSTFKFFLPLTRGSATTWEAYSTGMISRTKHFHTSTKTTPQPLLFIPLYKENGRRTLKESVVWSWWVMAFAELTQNLGGTCAWKLAAEPVNFLLFFLSPDVTCFKHKPVVKFVLWLDKQTAEQDAFSFPQKPTQLHPYNWTLVKVCAGNHGTSAPPSFWCMGTHFLNFSIWWGFLHGSSYNSSLSCFVEVNKPSLDHFDRTLDPNSRFLP